MKARLLVLDYSATELAVSALLRASIPSFSMPPSVFRMSDFNGALEISASAFASIQTWLQSPHERLGNSTSNVPELFGPLGS